MKKLYIALPLAFVLVACSRNPDPEYAADTDDAPAEVEVEVEAAPAVAPAPTPDAAPDVPRLSDEETMRLGQEAAALVFANDIETLWPRFDAAVQTQAGSAENFSQMVSQIFGQIGAETNVVEEEVIPSPAQPGINVYRRRGHYMAIGQDADLFIAFNADGTIAGINIMPAQE